MGFNLQADINAVKLIEKLGALRQDSKIVYINYSETIKDITIILLVAKYILNFISNYVNKLFFMLFEEEIK